MWQTAPSTASIRRRHQNMPQLLQKRRTWCGCIRCSRSQLSTRLRMVKRHTVRSTH
jgi:hypothetical protein